MEPIKKLLKKMVHNNFLIIMWTGLTILSLISLVSHRTGGDTPHFIYHFSKGYFVFLLVYLSGAILTFTALLKRLQGDYGRIIKGIGVLILCVAGLKYAVSGLYDSTFLPFAFPIQVLLLVFHTIYHKSKTTFFYFLVFSVLFFIAVKVFDISLSLILKQPSSNFPGQALEKTEKFIQTFDLYPYSGWHIQSNHHHIGDAPFEYKQPYSDYDIKSGPMGFFIEFDPASPPKKEANEFRIILIGGSGAQGWGGQKNENMLYKQLENQLNNTLRDTGKYVRVINMAMAGAITYQNYIALNRWGHCLEPALILSYSGYNDFAEPVFIEGTDGFQHFNQLNGLALAVRGSEFPPSLRLLKNIFPNIMTKTNAGAALKIFFSSLYFQEKAKKEYAENRKISYVSHLDRLEKIAIPMYVHALESIKRDYMGVPIMVAWQAISPSRLSQSEKELGYNFYNNMFETAKQRLNGYMNNRWYFINIHGMLENNPQQYIDVHLGNEGHRIVAGIIADEIEKIVRNQPTFP